MEEIKTKLCTKKKHFVPVSDFAKGNAPDGLQYVCRACYKEYRQANQAKLKDKRISRRLSNLDTLRKREKEQYYKHKEKKQAGMARWREQNSDKRRQVSERYYLENRDRILAYAKTWRQINRDRTRMYFDNRRARERQAQGSWTPQQWLAKCEFWGWRCYLCGIELNSETATREHRIPLSRGGSNWIANLAPACLSCNSKKKAKTEVEYRALQQT